jgi:hypothetical protein
MAQKEFEKFTANFEENSTLLNEIKRLQKETVKIRHRKVSSYQKIRLYLIKHKICA